MSMLATQEAHDEAYSIPLDQIDVSDPRRFKDDTI